MCKLIIIGAGGHGKVIADAAEKSEKYSEIAFIDDSTVETNVLGFTVLGSQKELFRYIDTHEIVVGIGNNETREKIQRELESKGYSIATVIHPSSTLGKNVIVGKGSVVMAGAVINVDSKIGEGCIINTSASIDHDCNIQDFVHVSPNVAIAGSVEIGIRTWVGIGATVSNNVMVGPDVIIGSSSNVIKDINNIGIYFGNPAKKEKRPV